MVITVISCGAAVIVGGVLQNLCSSKSSGYDSGGFAEFLKIPREGVERGKLVLPDADLEARLVELCLA